MNDRLFRGQIDRLRAPQRIALLEVDRTVTLTLDGITAYSALDVGTGTGIFAEAFATRGLTVTGIDVNPAMLTAAREFVPAGTFQEGALEAIPFPENSFDVVFLGHVLHETQTPVAALEEVRRVARQRVAILEWPYRAEDRGPSLDHRMSPEQITISAREAGFSQIETLPLSHMVLYHLTV